MWHEKIISRDTFLTQFQLCSSKRLEVMTVSSWCKWVNLAIFGHIWHLHYGTQFLRKFMSERKYTSHNDCCSLPFGQKPIWGTKSSRMGRFSFCLSSPNLRCVFQVLTGCPIFFGKSICLSNLQKCIKLTYYAWNRSVFIQILRLSL